MTLAGQGFELTGVSLFGPKPLEAVHLRLDAGLSVLYGQNGAGKTSILREAEAVLRGVGPHQERGVASGLSCLHVRISALDANPGAFEQSPFEEAFVKSFFGAEHFADIPAHATRRERWQWLLHESLGSEIDEDWIWDDPVLAKQDTITFCLVPRGTASEPAWGTYLSVGLDASEWSDVRESRRRQREFVDRVITTGTLAPDHDFGNDPVEVFGETPWARLSSGPGVMEPDHLSGWPNDFALPISALGKVAVPPVQVISDSGSIASTRTATNSLLVTFAEEHGELIELADDTETHLNPEFRRVIERLEGDANAFLELTGPHLFELRLELKSPHEWFAGEIPEWVALGPDGNSFGVGRLSGAELRWALAALQWSNAGVDQSRPVVLLIDEPERGLHRLREQELPRMLRSLLKRPENLMVLAGSHAPSFLDARVGAVLHHVKRLPGRPTALHEVELGTSSLISPSATQLGLTPSDLLQLTRVVVLVEGVHDEIVFEAVLGDDIRRARGRIIPINGAGHAKSIADARILLDATTATIVLVLDNINSKPVLDLWNRATEACQEGNRKRAKSILSDLSRLGRDGEAVWLQALGERAIETNVLHRIKPFGLSRRDVICYLPTSNFLTGEVSWADLSADYERAKNGGFTREDFKSWLKHKRGADFSRQRVKEAAQSLGGDVPREFADLSIVIQGLSLHGPIDELERAL